MEMAYPGSGDIDIDELTADMNEYEAAAKKAQIANKAFANTMKELSTNILELSKTMAKDLFTSPFETIGRDMIDIAKGAKDWNSYLTDAGESIKNIAAQMLSNMGAEMATAGFRIAAAGAAEGKSGWGKVALGLGLAATGGFASGLGSSLQNNQNESDDKDEIAKLESITGQIEKLLAQAKSDALYYENNFRHKRALGINSSLSGKTTSVNDAIIAPNGNVISTAPDDYLIATKQPQNLIGKNTGSVNVQPQINFSVINNTSAQVRQEQVINTDGSVQVIAYIEETVNNYIASSRSDEAFSLRQARLNGSQTLM